MKPTEIKENMKVIDIWFKDWGVGKVIEVLHSRVKIKFEKFCDVTTYDHAHCQFLQKV